MKFHFISSKTSEALEAKRRYVESYSQNDPETSDIIIPIGGDGILLKSLHDFNNLNKPFYGINYGSIGFLMNQSSNKNLEALIENSNSTDLKPLKMIAEDDKKITYESIAYNEVSLMRQSHQASKFQIKINDVIRLNELICDGVLVSTSAGSTAYNLSAHGSILPLDSKLLALTPISAFRPRRWRGALLSEKSVIKIDVLNFEERKTSVTADNIEFRNIKKVLIKSSQDKNCKILFDKDHSIEDKILNEQFEY
ncbi:MAG: NAD kinase [Pelagibacteraceae bacterium]|nr:NAD kinase [Pelagibacteraceae bacterium]|tara:strand:+ start:24668 stop:25426 length:759 start_codon:yes stop_codon:yes gene_type:complete